MLLTTPYCCWNSQVQTMAAAEVGMAQANSMHTVTHVRGHLADAAEEQGHAGAYQPS